METENKLYRCNFQDCKYSTQRRRNLKYHTEIHNPNRTKNYRCKLCSKAFYTKCSLMAHIRTHTQEKVFKCSFCPFSSAHFASLYSHKRKVHDEQYQQQRRQRNWKYKCDHCEYRAPHPYRIAQHALIHEDRKPFACTLEGCNYKGKSKSGLQSHQRSHSELPAKVYSCDKCSYQTRHPTALKRHAIRHIEEGPIGCGCYGDSNCNECLNRARNKRLMCPVSDCNFTTLNKDSLRRHAMTHSDDKPFGCEYCEHKSKTRSDLNVHKNRRHERRRTVTCPLCDKAFYNQSELQNHVHIHTGERSFQCPHPDCSHQAYKENLLNIHIRRHSKTSGPLAGTCNSERITQCFGFQQSNLKYKCLQCDYRTQYLYQVLDHAKLHGNEKPFACSIEGCNFKARLKRSLSVHLRSHKELPGKFFSCKDYNVQTRHPESPKEHKQARHAEEKDKLRKHPYKTGRPAARDGPKNEGLQYWELRKELRECFVPLVRIAILLK